MDEQYPLNLPFSVLCPGLYPVLAFRPAVWKFDPLKTGILGSKPLIFMLF